MKTLLITFAAMMTMATTAHAADVKSYQVTGPVLEMTDSSITVQKGTEKWQIAKGSAKVPSDVKVGSKVTIQYTMAASAVEAKPAKK